MKRFILAAIALCSLFSGCHEFENSYDPFKDLVAYYPFDGDANNKAGYFGDGIGGFFGNGILSGGVEPTTDRFGVENSAYSFDGKDGVITVRYGENLQIQGALTLSAWIYLEDYEEESQRIVVLQEREKYGGDRYGLWANFEGMNCFAFRIDSGTYKNLESTIGHSYDRWYLLTGVWNGSTMRLYIDGSVQADTMTTTSSSIGYDDSSSYVNIGGDKRYDGDYFNGKIDDVRIYSRALSQSEITAIYNGTDAISVLMKPDV